MYRPLLSLTCVAALSIASTACESSPDADSGGSGADGTEPAMSVDSRQRVGDFVVDTTYLDDVGGVMGRRWVHADHGMPVTVLRIQSVPQVFLHVNTPCVSDRGEPHTGEHLLLGKGRKGKELAGKQDMSLIGSTAYTSQSDVVYAWNCGAGKQTFYDSVALYLDALLLPNYTDEEVRREVGHLGYAQDRATGELTLEEKGTIYNEMVSAYEKRWNVFRFLRYRVWGNDHPLSWSSGGEPAAVREMEPRHIHEFHRDHYHLSANLGMIVAIPDTVPEDEFLTELTEVMARLDALPELAAREKKQFTIPPARPQAERGLQTVAFPSANEDEGGGAVWAWPPVVFDDQHERVMAEVLLATIGDTPKGTLYKRLMDGTTRELDAGASAVFAFLEVSKVDASPMVGFDGYPSGNANDAFVARITTLLHDEFGRIAALEPGSAELRAFNEMAGVQLTAWEKDLRKSLNAPPLFGYRSSGGFWLDHLRLLHLDDSSEHVVTMSPVFQTIRGELSAGASNPWSRLIDKMGVLGEPYVGISVASTEEADRRKDAQDERLAAHVERMKQQYGVADAQEALKRFKAEYDAKTAELAELDRGLPQPHLAEDLPANNDPSIQLEPMSLPAGGGTAVEGFRGIFDNVSFVETSLSFDLTCVKPQEYVWLPLLPGAITSTGVLDDGARVPYDQADKRRSEEIYSLEAQFQMRPSKDRRELRVTATGLDLDASLRAVDWLERVLHAPLLDAENVPRLRDLVQQTIRSTRGTLGGREERWVRNPAHAIRYQDDALYLSARSHHVALLHLARLEWMLMEPPPPEHAPAVQAFLEGLASHPRGRGDDSAADVLTRLIDASWPDESGAGEWIRPIGLRIRELTGDMAPRSETKDLRELGNLAWNDLQVTPVDAVAQLRGVLDRITGNPARARFVLTGSRANTDVVAERLTRLLAHTTTGGAAAAPGAHRPLRERLNDHNDPGAGASVVHYGIVHGGGSSGVFVCSADSGGLDDLDEETLLTELSMRVFGGSGPHGFFMRTWGAGLAYSNGLSAGAQGERISYYAERCPDLTETMKFVTGLVEGVDALDDPYLLEYTIANTLRSSRESDRFENRSRAAADEIVDGEPPERIAKYREAVLALRNRPELWPKVRERVVQTAGRVLPGVGPRSRDVAGGNFVVIAPEPMLAGWEDWVKSREGGQERVYRVYGRDFWVLPATKNR